MGDLIDEIQETVSIECESIRIGGADYPYQLVKNRFMICTVELRTKCPKTRGEIKD